MKLDLKRLAERTLFKHKRDQTDPLFDERLQQLGTREALRPVAQSGPFRPRPARREA